MNTTEKTTQKQKILNHLRMFGSITPLEAMKEYGCMRLAAVIFKLKNEYSIVTDMQDSKNRFGDKVRHAKYIFIGEKVLN
jgi:hypothetical protein